MRLEADADVRASVASDASGLVLTPESVARPASLEEVVELIRECAQAKRAVTPAGGQTSTTGASITDQGVLLSTRSLNQVLGVDIKARTVRVEPGILLGDLKRLVAEDGLTFAPDPTSEDECTVGGAIACNASGARTFKFGATRKHVRALKVILASGELVELRRSDLEKNTVGYGFAQDPIDWFIGSEGTLGVIVEAELALIPRCESVTGLAIPFLTEESALEFVAQAREAEDLSPRCLEFFGELALEIARTADDRAGWAVGASALVYTEDEAPEHLEKWLSHAEAAGALIDDVRVFESDAELRQARRIRHRVPSVMNERGAAYRSGGGRKVSTDWAVPYRKLGDAVKMANAVADAQQIDRAVLYGHAGNGHPHQNFIARSAEEVARIERVVEETLKNVLAMGGTIAAEHGIGKLKRKWLPLQMTPMQIGMMRTVKRELDPHGILAPGNIL
ncbi:MAG: FAD-binding oxidoreductase [Gemmatimonadaceae bacterium]|nr:FAD-binding oxidoreductase [Gemmatimonadaceae bacterium]